MSLLTAIGVWFAASIPCALIMGRFMAVGAANDFSGSEVDLAAGGPVAPVSVDVVPVAHEVSYVTE